MRTPAEESAAVLNSGPPLIFNIVFGAVLCVLALLVIWMIVNMIFDIWGHTASARKVRSHFAPEVTPKIAYKRATLLLNRSGDDQHLRGVVGLTYSPDEDAEGVGFHAYERLVDAQNHPQQGNVILEVLLSGNIEEHDLGYIATHQRVLQVIPDSCSYCGLQPTHFFIGATTSELNNYYVEANFSTTIDALRGVLYSIRDGDKAKKTVMFLCRLHTLEHNATNPFAKLAQKVTFQSDWLRSGAKPLTELNRALPWLDKHNVVVASLTGPNALVPTKIDEQS
jgi:hypothetical protein